MKRRKRSFISGMADVANSSRKSISNPAKSDLRALSSDWEKIGKDLRYAINKYKKEYVNE